MTTKRYVLAIDQGTTSSRAILFDHAGNAVASAQREFRQIFPQTGWVEHDPDEIWQTQLDCVRQVLGSQGVDRDAVAAVGITNRRETTLVWDRRTGRPVYNAIVWQDRRTAGFCDELRSRGLGRAVQEKTGLVIDAYFSGSKVRWILDHVDGARRDAEAGHLLFGNVDRASAWGSRLAPISNWATAIPGSRLVLEKVLGIHREKLLPVFAGSTFERWAESQGKLAEEPGGEAVLFQTCYVQNNEPEIGRDTVAVFERNQVDLCCTKGLGCCGMPAWETGDLETTRERAHHNLDRLMPFVEAGARVVAINPTCSMMMRREYPVLLEGADRERAKVLSEAVMDPSEFLWSIRKEERFDTDFESSPGDEVAYHAPCHLRAQAIGFKGRDLLRKIPGVKPKLTAECCGHDGTHAMKVEGFEPSQRAGERAFSDMQDAQAEVWATDCPLAAIQFQQFAGVKPMHPMSILARAYRPDGFPKKLGSEQADAGAPEGTRNP